MAEGFGREPGGIRKLRELIEEHPTEVEFELIRLGLRLDQLGSPLLSWRDLAVIVTHCAMGSPLRTALQGFESWTRLELLAAMQVNLQAHWTWLNMDEKKRGQFDPPVEIPGPKADHEVIELEGVPREQADQWLAGRQARMAARR